MEFQQTDQASKRQRRKEKEGSLFGARTDSAVREIQATAESLSSTYRAKAEGMYVKDDWQRMKKDFTKRLQESVENILYKRKLSVINELTAFISKNEEEIVKLRPDPVQRDRIKTKLAAASDKELKQWAKVYKESGNQFDNGKSFEADSLDIFAVELRRRGFNTDADEVRMFDIEKYHSHSPWENAEDYDIMGEAMENIDHVRNKFDKSQGLYFNPSGGSVQIKTIDQLFPDIEDRGLKMVTLSDTGRPTTK